MKSIGDVIKNARAKKKYSREKLEKETKIKRGFIEAIEREDWKNLPERPVVAGFVKNIAQVLGIDRKQVVARFRRDYPTKELVVNPKPDAINRFRWSPRLTFITAIVVVVFLILSYLGIQYYHFVTPPKLEVYEPLQEQIVTGIELKVSGITDPESSVLVNNQPALVEENGKFTVEIEIFLYCAYSTMVNH